VFDGSGVVVRTFAQETRYDLIDHIAAQMREDRIDVAVSDLNAAVGAALFTRRVAPLQMWTVMGYPYWSLSELDWVLLIGMEHQGGFGVPPDRFSYLRVRQEEATLAQPCAERLLREARTAVPGNAFVFAVFSRLIKISNQLLDACARILAAEPRAHLLIVGTGDPRAIYDFLERPELRGRVTFLHRNVDLNVFGRVIDVMLDTFPFHAGNAAREVAVHGKPVLAVFSPDWGRLLQDERDPLLLARDSEEFVSIALRLARDAAFYAERSAEATRLARRIVETQVMVDDVEAAIARAIEHHRVGVGRP
jgi:predicted O-linked N-acetylglucosamine transferase (SPINDLY family)